MGHTMEPMSKTAVKDETIGDRIREAMERRGLNRSDLARALKLTRAAPSQWINGDAIPRRHHLKRLAEVLDVTWEYLETGREPGDPAPPTRKQPMAEGVRIDPTTLGSELARPLLATAQGRTAEIWKLSTDLLAGAKYFAGDYVVVDLKQAPRARDIVLAEQGRMPVFRLYLPPYLYAAPLGAQQEPLVVDDIQIIVRGVIVARFSVS